MTVNWCACSSIASDLCSELPIEQLSHFFYALPCIYNSKLNSTSEALLEDLEDSLEIIFIEKSYYWLLLWQRQAETLLQQVGSPSMVVIPKIHPPFSTSGNRGYQQKFPGDPPKFQYWGAGGNPRALVVLLDLHPSALLTNWPGCKSCWKCLPHFSLPYQTMANTASEVRKLFTS